MTRRRWRETGLAALFLAPSLIVFAAFFFYPLYRLVHMATHEQRAFSSRERFVGLDQVTEVLGSSEFLGSVQVSAAYVVYTVPLGLALGILLAVAADRHLRGIAVFRTIFASTVATSVAVARYGKGQRQRLGVVLKVDTEFPLILIGPELFSFIGLETEAQQLEFIGMQVLIGILPVDEGFRKGGMGGFPDESKRKTIHRHRSWPFVLNPEVDPFLADTGGQNEIQPGRRHCFQAERLAVFQDLYLILPVQPYSYGNFPMAAPPLLTDLQQTGIVAWHAGAFYTIQ